MSRSLGLVSLLLLALSSLARAEEAPRYDLERQKVLYAVGYAHLDTQWRWDFTTTIDQYLKNTLDDNFALFEKYPGYVFSFTGSVRYGMMKEYYPERYEKLKKYIADGRWFVSGSSVDEGDVNVPSAEAVLRQVLYGNEYFRNEFGKESVDFMLPDCFGFPASMPSIWAHAGLKGFSTQKLTWGSAVGIPFGVGVWEGPDGRSVLAALDPGSYSTGVEGRLDLNEKWAKRIDRNGREHGVFVDYHYYGVGDVGGAPRERHVKGYLASVDNPDSLFHVALTSSDQMFRDITDEQAARLPRYVGDMLLTEHSAGTLTSQSYMKRWNRKGELLADAAERVAVAAHWLGAASYPLDKLNRAWERLLANQMHDILPGTSLPRAYTFSWNDEVLAQNVFAEVLTDSVGALTRVLDTDVDGVPLVVYNPLVIAREDVVEAEVTFPGLAPRSVQVVDPSGTAVPTQVLERDGATVRLLFLPEVGPSSLSVFTVRRGEATVRSQQRPWARGRVVENSEYRVTIDENGDLASIVDRRHGNRELLRAPARLVFTKEKPQSFPAWNMDWRDRQRPPLGYLDGPATIRVVEDGPVRAAIEVTRTARNSTVTQRIRLSGGSAGRRVEIDTEIDWQSTGCALRAELPLTVSNPVATYNWGMGTIERGNNDPVKYEVPSHEWFDLTDASGAYGVTVLEDSKFGSDKPDDQTVRLTLLYSPAVRRSYMDQHSQDWGRHEMLYAVQGHPGDWREAGTEWLGRRLNQPLVVFQSKKHAGFHRAIGPIVSVSTDQVDVRALKRAEQGDHVIVRLQELHGREAKDVSVRVGAPIVEAWEVDGQERRIGDARVVDGALLTGLGPYSPRSFAMKVAHGHGLEPPRSQPLTLPFDVDVVSTDADRSDGAFDADGRSLPAEQLPETIVTEGIELVLGSTEPDQLNAVACRGQAIQLPAGAEEIVLLAAATEDVASRLRVGDRVVPWSVQAWTGFIGQWDDRLWDREFPEVDFRGEGHVVGFTPGYIKRDPVAWFATHHHHPVQGNRAYRFSYLFKYVVSLETGDTVLQLPDDPRIKVLAATAVRDSNGGVQPAHPLYDDFDDRGPLDLRHVYPPPPVPVFQGVTPVGTFVMDKQGSFEELSMGAPRNDDLVRAREGGPSFRFHEGDGEWPPHGGSGAVDDRFPRLNDGEVAQNDDDTRRCVWYDTEGRFSIDLGRVVELDRVNTYSWHRLERAPQWFSLWGSTAEQAPSPGLTHGAAEGWTLLAVVDTRSLGQGGIQGSSVTGPEGRPLGAWRHLLWIAQDVGNGTFFTEIDVHAGR
ncbi:MAG: glycoside hydrolase family 38 C-terminal domain-containing protein [Acidobacteriota bacterium]